MKAHLSGTLFLNEGGEGEGGWVGGRKELIHSLTATHASPPPPLPSSLGMSSSRWRCPAARCRALRCVAREGGREGREGGKNSGGGIWYVIGTILRKREEGREGRKVGGGEGNMCIHTHIHTHTLTE